MIPNQVQASFVHPCYLVPQCLCSWPSTPFSIRMIGKKAPPKSVRSREFLFRGASSDLPCFPCSQDLRQWGAQSAYIWAHSDGVRNASSCLFQPGPENATLSTSPGHTHWAVERSSIFENYGTISHLCHWELSLPFWESLVTYVSNSGLLTTCTCPASSWPPRLPNSCWCLLSTTLRSTEYLSLV